MIVISFSLLFLLPSSIKEAAPGRRPNNEKQYREVICIWIHQVTSMVNESMMKHLVSLERILPVTLPMNLFYDSYFIKFHTVELSPV